MEIESIQCLSLSHASHSRKPMLGAGPTKVDATSKDPGDQCLKVDHDRLTVRLAILTRLVCLKLSNVES